MMLHTMRHMGRLSRSDSQRDDDECVACGRQFSESRLPQTLGFIHVSWHICEKCYAEHRATARTTREHACLLSDFQRLAPRTRRFKFLSNTLR